MICEGHGPKAVIKPRQSTMKSNDRNSLRKYAYSNILKIPPPKNEFFQTKKSDIFLIFAQKHRLWVLVRTVSKIYIFEQK